MIISADSFDILFIMAIAGQRFRIDLDNEHNDVGAQSTSLTAGLVGDIKERVAALDPKPPSPPRLKGSETGFPAHKVRTGSSKFKRRKENPSSERNQPDKPSNDYLSQYRAAGNGKPSSQSIGFKDSSIDQENKQRLAEMSDQEIEEARRELIAGLSPALIEKLLKKADIDDHGVETGPGLQSDDEKHSPRAGTFEGRDPQSSTTSNGQNQSLSWDPDGPPLQPPTDLHPASSYSSSLPQPPNIHFPKPPQPPDLDPSDPNFLSALHSNYFPNLPADPSVMAWMQPLDPNAENESSYSPSQDTLHVSAIRFNFRGHLLPPRLSAQIPSTKGLHHHAHAPSSAGYTVPELAHLARSSYPAQRCIAYQTLGRILYRLGRGDFGQEGEDLCEGLWQQMEQGKVIDQLVEAAAKGDAGNRSIWATATEAVWLWRKGGGRRWKGR